MIFLTMKIPPLTGGVNSGMPNVPARFLWVGRALACRACEGLERKEHPMEPKRTLHWKNSWKDDAIAILLLGAFAFFVNRGIAIKGLYMDDLYLWSCYGEQSFLEFNFPVGSTRFRFLYYLLAWLELALVGGNVTWFVPINLVLNILVAVLVYEFGKKLSHGKGVGFLAGILYLLSRMSYYQISQVYGLMETVATAMALGILFLLFRFVNHEGTDKGYYGALGLYFAVCFVHERYLVLLPLIFLALLLAHRKGEAWDWKKWAAPLGVFALIMGIRALAIGTVLPAGTGGTEVADTFSFGEAIRYALSQVAYIFGCNAGPEHLNGMSWADSPRWVKLFVSLADIVLAVLAAAFLLKMIWNRQKIAVYLKNTALFFAFIALCIGASSVTVRVELRWVYVSYTAAVLFLCYMFGVLREVSQERPAGGEDGAPVGKLERKRKEKEHSERLLANTVVCMGAAILYVALVMPTELFYRTQYPNLYFWPNQLRYNSLAEETYEKYGDEIFGKTIYIVGNTYEMSEFTADTFFKVYDKARKAEGTQVVFIDSVLDIGQVTEDMLVLREDPAHNAFQDITDVVRTMKCELIEGCYQDGWVDESAKMRVMAGADGRIHLRFVFPGTLEGGEITSIYRDGELAAEIAVTQNIYEQDIEAEPYQMVTLEIENNFYMPNALEQRGEKRLAVLLDIVTD